MHGCAPGSGAQKRNTNALKHGGYSKQAIEDRRKTSQIIKEFDDILTKLKLPGKDSSK